MTVLQNAMQPDSTREIIARCKRETRIPLQVEGAHVLLRPRLRGINHLQAGKSNRFSDAQLVERLVDLEAEEALREATPFCERWRPADFDLAASSAGQTG